MITYASVVVELVNFIPEYKSSESWKEVSDNSDLPYIVFGNLYAWTIENIKLGQILLVQKVLNFIQEIACINENKLDELIMFGFLENIDESKNADKIIIKMLKKETRQLYLQMIAHNDRLQNT
ncbi:MAG: hypothetical protein KBD73_00595 [Candidatus Magasanikbacteria bacterium]|nr:hypothetical protein [Candidatus Magasanikbacteria bacterium]